MKAFGLSLLILLTALAANAGELRSDIRRGNDDWIRAMKTRDAALVTRVYADDATFCKVDGTCVHGRIEIEALYHARFANMKPARRGKVHSTQIVRDGELAYEWGHAEVTTAEGKISGGKYLTVWRHEKSGAWKIFRNLVLP